MINVVFLTSWIERISSALLFRFYGRSIEMLLSKPEGLFEIGYGIFRYFILLLRLRFYGREEDAFD